MSALFWRFPYQRETPRREILQMYKLNTQTKHANNTCTLRHRPIRTLRVSIAEIRKKKRKKKTQNTKHKTKQDKMHLLPSERRMVFSPGSHFVSLNSLSWRYTCSPQGEPHTLHSGINCKGRDVKRSKRGLGDGKQGKSKRDCQKR